MLTQLSRSGQVLKLRLDDLRVHVTARFHIEGSVFRGTLASRPVAVETRVEVDSEEPRERLAHAFAVAEQSCYVLRSLVEPVAVETTFLVGGERLTT